MPKTSIEKIDIDACMREFDGSRYNLVLAATIRAREISYQRIAAARNGDTTKHESKPSVEALCDIAAGKVTKTYLSKIK